MAAGSSDKGSADLSTTTMNSRIKGQRGGSWRKKSRKKSRRKQRPKPLTRGKTETGNATLSQTHVTNYVYEITTPTSGVGSATSWNEVAGDRQPLNRKFTTAISRKTAGSFMTSSVILSPIATVVPYVDIGAERRHDYVTSGELVWSESATSVATVVGFATVSVLAFWLVVTVVVLSCLLARRTKMSAKPRTGCVVDGRWSWSGNQLIGLLDDSLDAAENARLFSAEHYDVSPPRWHSTSDARHRDNGRTLTAYRFMRQRNSTDEFRPAHTELLDSGYDTLAAATAAPEMDDAPEMTSFVDCGQAGLWTRQRAPMMPGTSCSQPRPADNADELSRRLMSQRRFPRMGQSCSCGFLPRDLVCSRIPLLSRFISRMGQSCLHRASPLRPFTETPTTRRGEDISTRRHLTGYSPLPRSDTTTDIGTTEV